MINAPLAGLDADLLQLRGRVLSVGCGFGVIERYIALRNHNVDIVGYELDHNRVAVAAATQSATTRVTVRQADVTQLGNIGTFDAALAIDVFHHLPPPGQTQLAETLARLTRPGGKVLVKDIAPTPRWKHTFNAAHDRLAVGDRTYCRSPDAMSSTLSDAGLQVENWRRVARLSPYPHYLVRLHA